jgi:serine/threonine protein kinase
VTTLPSSSPEETRVGDYRLLTPIGEGGMGVVHLAQGPDGKRVALKVLRPHIVGDREARERLAREVSSLQRISSPRIAEILDADPHGPVPFVVTRYVPGLSLYHHVAEEGPVAGQDLLHLADVLAAALQDIHWVGVLHRDVKPTNVLMEGRSPVLIDFGLARVADDPRLTQTGWLLGTPGYLAPEILYGDDATVASDVHAWAATVVFAATGRPPYGKGPGMAIMDRVRRGEFDLSGIAEPLAGLLRECLAPEPLERPTVHEIRDRIRSLRYGAPAVAPPAQPEPELWTMPFSPAAATPADPTPTTDRLPGAGTGDEAPAHVVAPLQAPSAPTRPSVPAVPQTRVLPADPPSPEAVTPAEAVAPVAPVPPVQAGPEQPRPVPVRPDFPRPEQARVSYPGTPPESSRAQRVLQLLGLGVLTSAAVAYAPYAGTALVATVVLVLRTASVTRQRHGRRRLIRGRARWYDVPTTTLSLPGYVVLAFFGALSAVAVAALSALAMFSLGYLFGQPEQTKLLMAGAGFTPALWWGPGSGRLREMTRAMVTRSARSEFGGWFVAVMCLLLAAGLVALLLNGGPNWAPAVSGPLN